jgi:hypothetical protein
MSSPIVRVDKSGNVPVYKVRKIMSDLELKKYEGRFLEEKDFKIILNSDADVYTEGGELLLKFRKNVLPQKHIEEAYDSLKDFIKNVTTDRGIATGSNKGLGTGQKKPVMSNIIGYYDRWGISQRAIFRRAGMKAPTRCRFTKFTANFPEKWQKVVPLIQDIDAQYKKLVPKAYASQRKAADSVQFKIPNTAFSTVTTNLNFRTAAHHDSGDWDEGFGNLVVMERGSKYGGAFTGFPQYGVAVDCRQGDFLGMSVHNLHGNSPMIPGDDTSQRISLVCYLRKKIVEKCQGEQLYDPVALQKQIQRRMTRKVGKKARIATDF